MKEELIKTDNVEVLNENGKIVALILNLSKKYEFDGKTYENIDLTSLDNLTAENLIQANRILEKNGNSSFLQEMTLEYACVLCSIATKLPIEFFESLHPKDAIKLKNRVTSFLYSQN